MSSSHLYEIAIKSPLRRLFTYESAEPLQAGSRVWVPFRNRERLGFVWKETNEVPKGLKSVLRKLDSAPLFNEATLEFYRQAADYYGISLGELLNLSVPKKIQEGAAIADHEVKSFLPKLPKLSEAQQTCVDEISKSDKFSIHLIHGETGSGKTEVYLHLMENILLTGGQVLFLVPEISLTPQLEERLSNRLGASVSVFHSNIREKLRMKTFSQARYTQTDVFLGARSALFLPFSNLKLIIVDEEHDSSYKQSERGSYHARDLAILKAKLLNIPIILGSATPSLETYSKVKDKTAKLYKLPKFFETPEPKIEILSLKKVWKSEAKSFITERLHQEIEDCLHNKNQALLFLNRRGSATQRICLECGHQENCPNCSASLTLHFDVQKGLCHLCGYQRSLEKNCSQCSHDQFFVGGIGTKEVEAQIQLRFPEARVARIDRDQSRKKNFLEQTLKEFADGKIDILIGTQMISKGIDIPNLSLIGIILADQGWGVPDFRAMERSFQLLKQILGRAGRRGQEAKCLIQSFFPEHPIFKLLGEENSFDMFISEEIQIREQAALPPFYRMLLWTLSDKQQSKVLEASEVMMKRLSAVAQTFKIQIFGPMEAPIFQWKNEFRYQILAKAKSAADLSRFMQIVLKDLDDRSLGVKIKTDRDPQHFM